MGTPDDPKKDKVTEAPAGGEVTGEAEEAAVWQAVADGNVGDDVDAILNNPAAAAIVATNVKRTLESVHPSSIEDLTQAIEETGLAVDELLGILTEEELAPEAVWQKYVAALKAKSSLVRSFAQIGREVQPTPAAELNFATQFAAKLGKKTEEVYAILDKIRVNVNERNTGAETLANLIAPELLSLTDAELVDHKIQAAALLTYITHQVYVEYFTDLAAVLESGLNQDGLVARIAANAEDLSAFQSDLAEIAAQFAKQKYSYEILAKMLSAVISD